MPIGTTVAAAYCFRPRLGHSLTYLGHDMDHVWITIVLYCDTPRGTYCTVISRYPLSIMLFRQTFI